MRTIGRRGFLAGTAGFVGGMTLYGVGARAQEQPVTAAHSVNTAIYAAHMIAAKEGFMKKEGLALHVIEAGGGSNVRRILAAGQVGYALGDSSHPLQISNRGKPAKMIMATDNRCSYANIIVRKELYDKGVTTVEKLAGIKRDDGGKPVIAATGIGSGTWLYGTYVLEQFGVNDKFNWVAGGGSKTMLGGLKTGKFDAIMAVPVWQFEAEDQGFGKAIYDVADKATWDKAFGGNIPTTVIYVLDATTKENKEITQAYVSAMYGAMQWLKAHSVDEIYKSVGETHMSRFPVDQVKREFAYYKAMWHYEGAIAEKDYANGAKVWYRPGTKMDPIAFADVVDNSFLAAAKKKYG